MCVRINISSYEIMATITPTAAIAELSQLIRTIESRRLSFTQGLETLLAGITATTSRVAPSQWGPSHHDIFDELCTDIVSTLEASDTLTDEQYLSTLESLVAMFTDDAAPARVISRLMDDVTTREKRLRQRFNTRHSITSKNSATDMTDTAGGLGETGNHQPETLDRRRDTQYIGYTATPGACTIQMEETKTAAVTTKKSNITNTTNATTAPFAAQTGGLTPSRALDMMFDVIHDTINDEPFAIFKHRILTRIISIARAAIPTAWSGDDTASYEHIIRHTSASPDHELSLPAFNAVVGMYTDAAPVRLAWEIRSDLISRRVEETAVAQPDSTTPAENGC